MTAPTAAPDLDNVIVLLTAGTDTQNRWTGTQPAIKLRTEKACQNVKGGGQYQILYRAADRARR
jgi:hypothetical protein